MTDLQPGGPRVALAGCTGQIGSRLISALEPLANLVILSRDPQAARVRLGCSPGLDFVEADVTRPGKWQKALADVDGVVNLFGEGILNRRWTTSYKEILRQSRVQSTLRIGEALKGANRPVAWANASAIGFYGASGPEVRDESAPMGNDFLAQLSREWEDALFGFDLPQVRKVAVRIGIVLDPRAGALAKMLMPFRLFLGGRLGWDRYPVSWIHHADLTGLVLHVLDKETVKGPINATAPHPVSNEELAQAIGKALGRPSLFPVPRVVLRILLGEAANAIALGRAVYPAKALATGYEFQFSRIDEALRDLVGKKLA